MSKTVDLCIDECDWKKVEELCNRKGIKINDLLLGFISDLVDGKYSNGSDERRLANEYFNRCSY